MRLLNFIAFCFIICASSEAHSSVCAPYCEEDKVAYEKTDKTIKKLEESKLYKVSGKVISIDNIIAFSGPPMLDKCYEKYHGRSYKLITFNYSDIKPAHPEGKAIEILQNPLPLKRLTLAIENSNLGYKENPELGNLQEGDSFSADAIYSGDECLSEIWLSNLKFGARILKNE